MIWTSPLQTRPPKREPRWMKHDEPLLQWIDGRVFWLRFGIPQSHQRAAPLHVGRRQYESPSAMHQSRGTEPGTTVTKQVILSLYIYTWIHGSASNRRPTSAHVSRTEIEQEHETRGLTIPLHMTKELDHFGHHESLVVLAGWRLSKTNVS